MDHRPNGSQLAIGDVGLVQRNRTAVDEVQFLCQEEGTAA